MLTSLGAVTVPTPGTIVPATHNQANPTARVACHAFMIQALPSNTGKVYIGTKYMSKSTGVGVIAVLGVPSQDSNGHIISIPAFSATVSYAPAGLDLEMVYLDTDNPNEGAYVSAVIG